MFDIEIQPLGPASMTRDQVRAALEKAMDDCPDCRAARARGEVPIFGDEFPVADAEPLARRSPFLRRPRWRTMKSAARTKRR